MTAASPDTSLETHQHALWHQAHETDSLWQDLVSDETVHYNKIRQMIDTKTSFLMK